MKVQGIEINGQIHDIGSTSYKKALNNSNTTGTQSSIEASIIKVGTEVLLKLDSNDELTSEQKVILACVQSRTNIKIIIDTIPGEISPEKTVPPIQEFQSILDLLEELDYDNFSEELSKQVFYLCCESIFNRIILTYLEGKGIKVYYGTPKGGNSPIILIRNKDEFMLMGTGKIKLKSIRVLGNEEVSSCEYFSGINYNGVSIFIKLDGSSVQSYFLSDPINIGKSVYNLVVSPRQEIHFFNSRTNTLHYLGASYSEWRNNKSIGRFYLNKERTIYIDFSNGVFSKIKQTTIDPLNLSRVDSGNLENGDREIDLN